MLLLSGPNQTLPQAQLNPLPLQRRSQMTAAYWKIIQPATSGKAEDMQHSVQVFSGTPETLIPSAVCVMHQNKPRPKGSGEYALTD